MMVTTVTPDDFAVFPVDTIEKRPLCRWREESDEWDCWASIWPRDRTDVTVGIGIDCGKSGIVVVDEDEPNAVSNWLGHTPNATYRVTTGRGTHYYFVAPDGVKIKNGVRIAPGVDIRAAGGFVVGPGALHRSGRRYKVVDPDQPIQPMPDHLLAAILDTQGTAAKSGDHSAEAAHVDSPPSAGWVAAGIDGELEKLHALPRPWREGAGWDTTTYTVAVRLVELANAVGDLDGVRARFMQAAPFDQKWDKRANKWQRALNHVGDRAAEGPEDYEGFELEIVTGSDTASNEADSGDLNTDKMDDKRKDGERPGHTWDEVDTAGVVKGLLAGTLTRVKPTVAERADGAALFYPNKVNGLAGASGCGKTWTALLAAYQEIPDQHVVYVDLEDDVLSIMDRLLSMGADPDDVTERFHYVSPSESLRVGRDVLAKVLECGPSLVVIDSVGEAMALDGLDQNEDRDVTTWFAFPKSLADAGAAVLVLDHQTKADSGAGSLWPIGSQRKRAAITGAQFIQRGVSSKPLGRGLSGQAKVICAKDRLGNWPQGRPSALLNLSSDDEEGTVFAMLTEPPEKGTSSSDDWQPTGLMEAVSKFLEAAKGPQSTRSVKGAVGGKGTYADQAIDELVKGGWVKREVGPRSAKLHNLITPYREGDSPPVPSGTGQSTD